MNHQETVSLMSYLKSIYPNYYKDDYKSTLMSWEDALIEESPKSVMKAAREYVKDDVDNKHPSIGRLRLLAQEIRHREIDESKPLMLELTSERTPEQQAEQDKIREGICKILGIKFIPSSEYKTKEEVEKEEAKLYGR